jgi:carboxypeptidase Taq
VHEVGHALYEQGRNPDYDNLPVSRALSMGVHESQSLLWERMVFQSTEFWDFMTPTVHAYFPHTTNIAAKELYEYVNRVRPDLIRTQADEVTYPMVR